MGTNDPPEPTLRETASTEETLTPGMQIVRETIALSTLERMAELSSRMTPVRPVPRYRRLPKDSRMSRANSSGCSNAAK
jgi:hypothetical protein